MKQTRQVIFYLENIFKVDQEYYYGRTIIEIYLQIFSPTKHCSWARFTGHFYVLFVTVTMNFTLKISPDTVKNIVMAENMPRLPGTYHSSAVPSNSCIMSAENKIFSFESLAIPLWDEHFIPIGMECFTFTYFYVSIPLGVCI